MKKKLLIKLDYLIFFVNSFYFYLKNFDKVNLAIFNKSKKKINDSFGFKIKQLPINENFKLNKFVNLKNVFINGPQYLVSDLTHLYTRKFINRINIFQYFPIIPIFVFNIKVAFGYCFIGRCRKNYGHNIMDIYFGIYLKEKLKINGDIVFFGKINKTDQFFLKCINPSSKIIILPDYFFAVKADKYFCMPSLYFHHPYFEDFLFNYLKKIKNTALEMNDDIFLPNKLKLFAIRRGYARSLKLENYVEKFFEQNGYTLINFDNYTVNNQIKLIQNTKFLAGFHGSNLINGGFMNQGTIVEITTHFGHDRGEFEYFGLINGNKFINLDIREELRSEQKIMKVLDTKLKVFFNKHKI